MVAKLRPVKAEGGADDFEAAELAGRLPAVLLAVQPGHLHRRFVGIGAAVAEEALAAEALLGQLLGQQGLRLGMQQVAHVPQLVHLLGAGGHEIGMAMAENPRPEATEQIQILPALGVGEHAPATFDHHQWVTGEVMGHVGVMPIDNLLSGRHDEILLHAATRGAKYLSYQRGRDEGMGEFARWRDSRGSV
jgi:hypothetical protein